MPRRRGSRRDGACSVAIVRSGPVITHGEEGIMLPLKPLAAGITAAVISAQAAFAQPVQVRKEHAYSGPRAARHRLREAPVAPLSAAEHLYLRGGRQELSWHDRRGLPFDRVLAAGQAPTRDHSHVRSCRGRCYDIMCRSRPAGSTRSVPGPWRTCGFCWA